MVKTLIHYARLWKKMAGFSVMIELLYGVNAFVFVLGKILRFVFFTVFLLVLFGQTKMLAGYSQNQVLMFYLTFNLVDTLAQFLYRDVYRFRPMIVSGDFDLVLIKPMNALFRSLTGRPDPMDFFMLFPYVAAIGWLMMTSGLLNMVSLTLYALFFINGLLIATAFHILVLSLAIVTTEIDHAIMIYRDLTSMGRVPVDIYRQPVRSILTFVVPVGIMMTFPVKAFLGLLSPVGVASALVLSSLFFIFSLKAWRWSLSRYASASS